MQVFKFKVKDPFIYFSNILSNHIFIFYNNATRYSYKIFKYIEIQCVKFDIPIFIPTRTNHCHNIGCKLLLLFMFTYLHIYLYTDIFIDTQIHKHTYIYIYVFSFCP